MKHCEKCDIEYEGDELFCSKCGGKLIDENTDNGAEYCKYCGCALVNDYEREKGNCVNCDDAHFPSDSKVSDRVFVDRTALLRVVVIAIVALFMFCFLPSMCARKGNDPTGDSAGTVTKEISYIEADLGEMLDQLEENALKAENTYQNKNIEFTGKINVIDSDGKYITVRASNDVWEMYSVHCTIQNKTQLDFIMDKKVGDTVTIRGKVTDIGELLGYILDIHSIE